jgi:signal transduction histidine kinase
MTPESISKLRRTFIAIFMVSFFIVICFMGTMSYVAALTSTMQQAERTLDVIIEAGGVAPKVESIDDAPYQQEALEGLRYFAVFFDADGNVRDVDLTHVASIDWDAAVQMADEASSPNELAGLSQKDGYVYKEGSTPDGGSIVVFLDYSYQLAIAHNTGVNTVLVSIIALLATFVCVVVLSGWAIQPEVENARRQQKFMTNASHELKTPISVIRANTEVTEMISGETEWTQSTLRQVDRLDGMVRDLMTIARGAEREISEGDISEIDATKVVGESVESFRSLASTRGVILVSNLDEHVSVVGTAASLEQLTCLLLDNSVKYCDPLGTISVRLMPQRVGRGCTLMVSNTYADGADVDYKRFFDRFYREDESHENQQGYGIGLSVAESICTRYRGSIKVGWKSGSITFTCVLRGM